MRLAKGFFLLLMTRNRSPRPAVRQPPGAGPATGEGSHEGVSSSKLRFEYINRDEILKLVGVERVRKIVGSLFCEIDIFRKICKKLKNVKN